MYVGLPTYSHSLLTMLVSWLCKTLSYILLCSNITLKLKYIYVYICMFYISIYVCLNVTWPTAFLKCERFSTNFALEGSFVLIL